MGASPGQHIRCGLSIEGLDIERGSLKHVIERRLSVAGGSITACKNQFQEDA